MNKLQMDPPAGGGMPAQFIIKVQRQARPPTPWRWEIFMEGERQGYWRSKALYRSAEDAWQAGQVVRVRLGRGA
jgi:hypothetical protein